MCLITLYGVKEGPFLAAYQQAYILVGLLLHSGENFTGWYFAPSPSTYYVVRLVYKRRESGFVAGTSLQLPKILPPFWQLNHPAHHAAHSSTFPQLQSIVR